MNINFMDACHLKINGNDIYRHSVDSLIGTYQIKMGDYKRGIATIVKRYCPKILSAMGIVGTLNGMHLQTMKDYEKALESFDDYRKKVKERYAPEA